MIDTCSTRVIGSAPLSRSRLTREPTFPVAPTTKVVSPDSHSLRSPACSHLRETPRQAPRTARQPVFTGPGGHRETKTTRVGATGSGTLAAVDRPEREVRGGVGSGGCCDTGVCACCRPGAVSVTWGPKCSR